MAIGHRCQARPTQHSLRRAAAAARCHQVTDAYPVRILPRVCGGWHAPEIQIVQPAFIIHKFAGSWLDQKLNLKDGNSNAL